MPEAAEVVFIAQDKPADQFVNHVIGETMQALGPILQKAIAEKRPIKFTTPAGARYFLKSVATDDLLKMDRTPAVYLELLFRPGVRDEFRREALTGLAKQDKKREVAGAGRCDQGAATNPAAPRRASASTSPGCSPASRSWNWPGRGRNSKSWPRRAARGSPAQIGYVRSLRGRRPH